MEAGIGVRTAIVALILEVWIRGPGIRGPIVRVKRQAHLILVLVLFRHLFEGLGRWAQFCLREVHVGGIGWHPAFSRVIKYRR